MNDRWKDGWMDGWESFIISLPSKRMKRKNKIKSMIREKRKRVPSSAEKRAHTRERRRLALKRANLEGEIGEEGLGEAAESLMLNAGGVIGFSFVLHCSFGSSTEAAGGGGGGGDLVRHRSVGVDTADSGCCINLGVDGLLTEENNPPSFVQLLGLGLGLTCCFSAGDSRRADVQKALLHPVPISKTKKKKKRER